MPTTTLLPRTDKTDRIGFPWDLTEWIEKDRLLRWVTEEVEAMDWDNPALAKYLKTHPEYRPKTLMSLLIFAYATGVYASEDIAEQCLSNADFRSICAPVAPSAQEIAAFRKENRGLLKWCLDEMLKRALREHLQLGADMIPAGLRRQINDATITRLDMARYLDGAAQAA